jgi:outer membrane lipoprotein-sorting protein
MPPEGIEDEMKVQKSVDAGGTLISYRRTPLNLMAAGMYSILIVDAKTGYPVAEENFVNGQKIMRSEFFDVGAPIPIELPACLEEKE